MQKQIKDLPIAFQSLFAELKAEKDIEEGSATDYVIQPTKKDVQEEYEQLDTVLEDENEADYDEYDENTYDMNAVSPYMRDAFGEFDDEDEDEYEEDDYE
ncbi:MAG: hypothetical protein CBC02_008415 [Flavobacteriaceae bacterium TMED42]|jgi:hypothetical protein|nr:MAG: hypothetical protein CBC02_008415 [Flavobacteriaceae bacterium TMED42]|tara:strand:+ start:217 stop:516 length:300 start_codon:yes stop_codon:yes gene_type:complete